MKQRKRLSGVIPPMITPLDENQNVDEQGVRNVVDRCIKAGVSGLFLLGSMGEGQSILNSEKKRLVEIAVNEAKGRVPILAGISAEGTRKVMENAAMALDAGADYIVSLPPYYFSASDQQELIVFFSKLARNLTKPLLIYNNPYVVGNALTMTSFKELSQEENIIGVKDSGDFTFHVELIREFADREDFVVLSGNEFMADASLAMGTDGIVPGCGTLFPEIFVEMYRLAPTNDTAALKKLQTKANEFMRRIYLEENWAWVAGQKYALSSLGLCGETMSIDNRPLHAAEKTSIRQTLAEYGIEA